MSEAFERFRDTLDTHGSKVTTKGQGFLMAQCPAHPDNNPSLEVKDKGDRIGVHCYAGCQTDDVVAELGMELRDLFDGEPTKDKAVPIRSYVYETLAGEPWIIKDRYFPKTFIQRLPGTEPGDRSGLRGRVPILYHAPRLLRAMRAEGPKVCYLVDGEKDVETLERHGLVATCPPGGAGATWREEFSAFLKGFDEVVIVTDQDVLKADGSLGTGQQFAQSARMGLRSVGIRVRIVAPAVGKDSTDHFTAGYDATEFVPEPTAYTRPRGMKADALMERTFEPLMFAVEGLLPAGLAIMAGSPKAGKTWAALSCSLAVASGGPALSCLNTTQGSVLHLAREDTYRRLQSRINMLMGGEPAPSALEIIPSEEDWIGGETGLANMEEWAEEVRDPRLVVLDTLAKVEPDMGEDGRRGAYAGNYSMMARYKAWADAHNCCVLMIHHDTKTKPDRTDGWMDDPFSQISGTRGLTGAADTLVFLESKRLSREGRLHITGRDVAEQSLEMMKTGPLWNCLEVPLA